MDDISKILDEALRIIEKLVSFDTESAKTNLPLIRWVEAELLANSVQFVELPNASGDKAALFVTFGPQADGGVVLCGHTDVVPTVGQTWSSDPYIVRHVGDRIYGRGVCDMKGFVGAVLAMAQEFNEARLIKPIHLLLTYDEEITCLGPVDAIRRFGKDLPLPSCVIVGEPTLMNVADAHKSVSTYITKVSGVDGHSSRPALGVNAIQIASALILEIYRIGSDVVQSESRFDPPGSTVSVGRISGGIARNIIARECWFEWEFRGEPHVPADVVLNRLEDYVRSARLQHSISGVSRASISTHCEVSVPGLRPTPGSPAEGLAMRLTRSNQTYAMPFATEAGRFQAAGLPVVICGPGDINQAHQPDEFIEIAQIAACLEFMRSLISELS